ncbi:3'-5' exonuclease [Sulfurisoma sediminicola]|uniref:DNA-directed DNA polymerase n=1 Tax=Sulfurisoma sediminicola TaxID=1381557 RepID=A0A497XEX1_9PROT|nr:exonuclease domain-containing protein [Sulfurisoma sediminicola]RLJ65095.1 DNA polymerase-3 subunit epsilon [Sulfurisoma sediminicola]
MNAKTRFALAVVMLGLLMTGPFLLTVGVLWADLGADERAGFLAAMDRWLPIGGLITIVALILGLQLLRALFRQYVQGLMAMAETLRLMLGANRNFRVTLDGPPEVQELARAANDLAQQRDALLGDVEAQIGEAKASVEAEKNRLAALMSELALGVVVCNLDGRILLYNNRARLQFVALAQGPTSMSGGALIGLGRSIFSILERAQVAHALENIRQRLQKGSAESVAHFITTTRTGQLLRAQMAPVLRTEAEGLAAGGDDCRITGYVLTIENITKSFEREAQRDQVLQQLTDGSRAALGNIRAAVENLIESPDMEPAFRERFLGVIDDETRRMSERLGKTMNDFADSLKTRWPLEDVLGIDVVAAAQRRIEDRLKLATKSESLDDALWIRADSFTLIQAMTFLASRLQDHYDIRELRFRLLAEGKMAFIDLIWSGTPVSSETLYTWELEPMHVAGEVSPLTLRDMAERHGGEIWYQRDKAAHRAYFRLVLPVADTPEVQHVESLPHARSESRPEYYDFDLFNFSDTRIDLDRKLTEVAYSVFDTETTGLEPSAGDEIIQIGAVRAINGRLLRQEVIDQIIDPRRPLKPEGIPIHGITEDMVRGQPTIDVVLPVFHEFCADTVLVAHNAAFDMRFLQLKQESTGLVFDQPVLDTLLLSAVIHPNQESHRLEAIAERLGINVIGRHTALGDAFVTGEVFLKMVPLLADMGIHTLREALAAAEQTYYARVKY